MRLRLHPGAMAEVVDAVAYLERERGGFGALFFEEVTRRVAQAARLPKSGSPILGFAAELDVRQFVMKRFRYIVVTAVIGEERLVIAVAHTSRSPLYWRGRLPLVEPRSRE